VPAGTLKPPPGEKDRKEDDITISCWLAMCYDQSGTAATTNTNRHREQAVLKDLEGDQEVGIFFLFVQGLVTASQSPTSTKSLTLYCLPPQNRPLALMNLRDVSVEGINDGPVTLKYLCDAPSHCNYVI